MTRKHLIVGIGASAGGLEAFKNFFDHMPSDSGIGFVLIQHLAPEQPSILAELVQRHTKMDVVVAAEGMQVTPNCVFVIPPDATLTLKDEHLHIARPAPARGHRYPVDAFFMSLAEDCGERAVSIILSGGGSDGTLGLTSVKEHGGFTLAQADDDSKAMLGMPQSASATGLVDFVMPAQDMPGKLLEYQQHLNNVETRKGADGTREDIEHYVEQICAVVRNRTGHDFSQYKTKTLIRRIQRRMQLVQIDAVAIYLRMLRQDARETQLLFRDLLINVTQFFRDPESFEILEREVIPHLFGEGTADDTIRVWVPGCATGEEAYSIAILLKEAMNRQEINRRVQIFATDIDDEAVRVARSGRFASSISSDISRERFDKWFVKEGNEYCPHKTIREMCIFSTHNLLKDPPFSKLDLISCRNLFIYLNGQVQVRVLEAFHYSLRSGGYLFLGSSEGVAQRSKLFDAVEKKHRIFRRKDAAVPLPGFPIAGRSTSRLSAATSAPQAQDAFDRLWRPVLTQIAPACVVINKSDEIIRYFGQTGRYLEPSPGTASLHLFSVLRPELRGPVRALLAEVREFDKRRVLPHIAIPVHGSRQLITLIVAPLDVLDAETDGSAIVAFHEEGSPISSPEAAPVEATVEHELRALRIQLNATSADLEAANEELKSSNEEYQSVNEELQSTNEELETAKEELQSTNEELQTLNGELIIKNDDLARANSDLRNFLDSTDVASLFLDKDLRIRTFTPAMTDLINIRDGDRGRPISDLTGRILYDDLEADVKKVARTLSSIEREIKSNNGGAFMMRIRPYRSVDNVIDGAVLTFVDLTGRRRAGAASEELGSIIEHGFHEIYICDSGTLLFTIVNQAARESLGYTMDELRKLSPIDIAPEFSLDTYRELIKPLLSGANAPVTFKTSHRRKDGSSYPVDVNISRVLDPPLIVINAVDLKSGKAS